MNKLNLIAETNFNDIILEKSESGDLFIEGIFMQAETRNRNGRIYPVALLEREVDKYYANSISLNRAMGELNHPPSPSVNPERASHLIQSLKREGNNFVGKAKVLSTPIGSIVRSLIQDGVNLGVSSRGLGSMKEGTGSYRGAKVVQDDYRFVTVDIVSDPSAHDAWVNGVFESVDYVIEKGVVKELKAEKLKQVRNHLFEKQISEAEKLAKAKALIEAICALSK